MVARGEYKDNLCLLQECTGVEAALINQLNTAFPPLYLEQYQDRNPQKITINLQSILNDIFITYGEITDNELKEAETVLQETIFNIS